MISENQKSAYERLRSELRTATENGLLKKAVLSKPRDKKILKAVAEPFGAEARVKLTCYLRDGKALQNIYSAEEAVGVLADRAFEEFGEINLVGNGKTLTLMISEKGKNTLCRQS